MPLRFYVNLIMTLIISAFLCVVILAWTAQPFAEWFR